MNSSKRVHRGSLGSRPWRHVGVCLVPLLVCGVTACRGGQSHATNETTGRSSGAASDGPEAAPLQPEPAELVPMRPPRQTAAPPPVAEPVEAPSPAQLILRTF